MILIKPQNSTRFRLRISTRDTLHVQPQAKDLCGLHFRLRRSSASSGSHEIEEKNRMDCLQQFFFMPALHPLLCRPARPCLVASQVKIRKQLVLTIESAVKNATEQEGVGARCKKSKGTHKKCSKSRRRKFSCSDRHNKCDKQKMLKMPDK